VTDDLPWLSPGSRFPDTRISIVERLRSADSDVRTEAFGQFATGYWKPVYKYLRLKWRLDGDDAADATQAFLASAFEKAWLARFDPAQARFRTFLRVCVDRFVMNRRKAESAQRRGGAAAMVSLDFASVEGELAGRELSAGAEADDVFDREVVREVFARALAAVRAECERSGKEVPLRVFVRYDLDPPDGLTYADVAREFAIPVTQVTNHLAAVRRLFRARALEELRVISGTDAEFRAEARELFGITLP
jgi:DNA-directed RNA polymerase specialized sigma24 family protein